MWKQIYLIYFYQADESAPTFVDLDGDGDADVLSASKNDDKIAWYENMGGGSFGDQQVITQATSGAAFVYATDLDGDSDVDLLLTLDPDIQNPSGDKVVWLENLGGGVFDNHDADVNLGESQQHRLTAKLLVI